MKKPKTRALSGKRRNVRKRTTRERVAPEPSPSPTPSPFSSSASRPIPRASIDRESRSPQKTREASEAMYVAMGGREGVLALLDGVDAKDMKANALRDLLLTTEAIDHTLSFAKMRQRAGYSAGDIFEMFNDRQHATALVVAAASKPRLVQELVDAASVRRVPCPVCGGTKRVAELDDDGEFERWRACEACDEHGLIAEDGNAKARELYFGTFVKENVPLVQIDARRDQRSVTFNVGGPGSAPSPLALIQALDRVPDVGRMKELNAAQDGTEDAMRIPENVAEAQTV